MKLRPNADSSGSESSGQSGPIVTVFCPIYNDADLCRQAIDSVLNQSFRNFRLVVFDNGSLDKTRAVVRSYTDERIEFLESHLNLKSEIMADLMSKTTTKYLAQIYSDDVWQRNKLEVCIATLEREGADAVFSNNIFIGDTGRVLRDEEVPGSQFTGDISSMTVDEHLHRFVLFGNSLHPVSMVITNEAYRRVGGVKPYLHSVGDMELFARLLLNAKVVLLKEKLQKIRIKTAGRQNESAPSIQTYRRVLGERMMFLRQLRTPQFLDRINQVFFPAVKNAAIPPSMRKWFLGNRLFKLGDPDIKFFAIETMYEAIEENADEIEIALMGTYGTTIGQYMEEITSRTAALDGDIASEVEIARLNGIIRELSESNAGNLSARLKLAEQDFFNQKAECDRQRDIADELRNTMQRRDAEHNEAIASIEEMRAEAQAILSEGQSIRDRAEKAERRAAEMEEAYENVQKPAGRKITGSTLKIFR